MYACSTPIESNFVLPENSNKYALVNAIQTSPKSLATLLVCSLFVKARFNMSQLVHTVDKSKVC